MNKLLRVLIILALVAAAITCYAMGTYSGLVAIVVLGFLIEGAAWSLLLRKKKADNKHLS